MKLLHKIIIYTLSLCHLAASPLLAHTIAEPEVSQLATSAAINLPAEGHLKKKTNGTIYLDVSNAYITSLAPLLDIPGKLRLPSTAIDAVGAHITVFKPNEMISPVELGEAFPFAVKEVKSLIVQTSGSLIKQWVVTVDAPALEGLRQEYGGLPPMEGGFHIIISQQVPSGPADAESIDDLASHNFDASPTLPCATQGDFKTYATSDMLKTAMKVDAVGKLRMQNNGFVYVDASNSYIEQATAQIQLKGAFTPIDTAGKAMGAHVSVFYEDEMLKNHIWYLEELGQWFAFEIKELRYVDRITPKGKKRLWLLAVDAPALQRLRKQYGLKPKLNGHDFHISIGNEALE